MRTSGTTSAARPATRNVPAQTALSSLKAPATAPARPTSGRTASSQSSPGYAIADVFHSDHIPLDAPQFFAPPEHRALGDNATNQEVIHELNLGDGTSLTFGDLVALSGDWFSSAEEIRKLATTKEGRDELRWARWVALAPALPEPDVSIDVKQKVRTRYLTLAADNSGHFSHGGTAIANYQRGHAEAIRKAREAGATGNDALFAQAVTDEACSQHFLTDCFSSGHVRTPIIAIRDHYRDEMADSMTQVFAYAAQRVAESLKDRGDVPWYWPGGTLEKKILETIQRSAGNGVESFSLGDIVVLSYHNADCHGLDVVSDVDASGAAVPGGHKWRAVGDRHLIEGSDTWHMAVAAMRASRAELDEARAIGARGLKDAPAPKAESYIPREDTLRATTMSWQWGSMDDSMIAAINETLRGQLLTELRRNAPQPPVQRYNRRGKLDPNGAVVLHVGEAFEAFCKELERDGIKVLEKAIGQPAR